MKMMIEIPDDNWIASESDIKPKHGELCMIMYRTGDQTISIGVYIDKTDHGRKYSKKPGYFIGVGDAWFENGVGCDDIQESYCYWEIVDKWKPIGLSEEDKTRIMATTREIYGYEDGDPAPWEGTGESQLPAIQSPKHYIDEMWHNGEISTILANALGRGVCGKWGISNRSELSLEEVSRHYEWEIKDIRNLGKKSFDELVKVMAKYGMALRKGGE